MSGTWTPRAFEPLVDRLKAMGAPARIPSMGEDTDAYIASLMGWMLDVLQPNVNARAQAYWNTPVGKRGAPRDRNVLIDHDAAKLIKGERVETPKAHIIEQSGRSYRIEGAVMPDGSVVKPGEPMPPKDDANG